MLDFFKSILLKKDKKAGEITSIIEIEPQIKKVNVAVVEEMDIEHEPIDNQEVVELRKRLVICMNRYKEKKQQKLRPVVFFGKTYESEQVLAEEYNVQFTVYRSRLSHGWSREEALGIVERIPEEEVIADRIFLVDEMLPGIRKIFEKNIYCLLGISADSNLEQVIDAKNSIGNCNKSSSLDYKTEFELPYIEEVKRDCEHIDEALNQIATKGLLNDKWLWFKKVRFIPVWNKKILDLLTPSNFDYDLLLACYFQMLISDPTFTETRKWKKVLSLIDKLIQKEDEDLFEIISEHINVLDCKLFSKETIVESFRIGILEPLFENIRVGDDKYVLCAMKYWHCSKYSFGINMFLCCQDVILNQVQNKVQDLVAYSDFFRDNIQLFVSDSGVAKEKTNALLFEMDKLVPLFVELNAQNKDCSKALCSFKDGFIKLGNVMGKVGLVEYAAKIFSSVFMLCSKEEKEQIKHQVPLILLSDIPESEFEYAEKMMIANAFDDKCDYEHAFKWYESAVEEYRVREAGYKIGTYYENGYAVEKDVPKAYEWYERAAWSGNRESIIKLARTYYYGSLYVSKDYEKAKKYFIQLFIDTPEKSLEEWLNTNFPGWKIDENDAYSKLAFKRSKELVELANLGIAAASYWLGFHYYGEYWTSGFYGYKENKALSRRWYLEAALTDYAPAIDELKERFRIEIARVADGEKMFLTACNYSEEGSEQEKDLRFYWLRKAVDYGYEDACNLLGICYDEAIGTTCDYEKANKLYLRAIEYNDNSGAYYNYAVNLYLGNGCKKNLKRAKKYFWIACEKGIEPAIECLKEYYGIDYIKEKQPSNYFLSKRPWYYPKTFCSETLIESVCSNENFEEIRIYDNYGLMVEFGGYEIFEENVYLKIMVNNSTGHICYFWLEDMFVNGERQNRHTELEECEADYEWHCYKIKIEKAAADYYNNIEFTTAVSNQYGNSLGKADRVIAKILCPENEIFVQII